MPFPASLTPITLTGTFLDGDSLPRQGVVKVLMPTPIRSEGDDVVIPPFELDPIDLDQNGFFSVEVPPTTDPDWLPNTAEYVVMAEFSDDYRKLWWSFPLPHDGGPLDLADAGEPNVGTPALTIRQGVTQPLADGGFKGAYGAGVLYRTGDTVIHSSAVYGALRPSQGVVPGTDPTVWTALPDGPVDSVNGETGVVVLTAAEVGAAAAAHAANHAAAGSDPVTLTQAQVTGLTAALAGKLSLTGGTLTGDLQIEDTGIKGYRFRRSGGALDLDATGAKLFVSVFSGTNFDGTQRVYLVLESGVSVAQAVGQWQFRQTADGTERHRIDATNGVASIGSKNGLANIPFCGFKNSAGAPSTGTWDTGDVVLTTDGWYRCTAGGTPGTWAEIV